MTQLFRLTDVIKATGLSRSAIYRLEAEGKFPGRVRLSQATSAWRSDEVQDWIDARPRVRSSQAAAQ